MKKLLNLFALWGNSNQTIDTATHHAGAVNSYCTAPFPTNASYAKMEDAGELVFVNVMTRHGDRAPLGQSLGKSPGADAKEWSCSPGSISDKNVGLSGVDSPKSDMSFGRDGSCKQEDLTVKGIQQLHALGKGLGGVYSKQILGGISVRSTWTQRTYWSAVALMSGLLDSNQPKFNITSMPLKDEGLVHIYNDCKKEKALNQEILKSNDFKKSFSNLRQLAIKYNATLTHDRLSPYYAVDSLRCLHCHQLLPGNPSDIFDSMDHVNAQLYFSLSPIHSRLRIGTFLKDLKSQLINVMDPKSSSPSFSYTSAHDASISALLNILNFNLTKTPPYASNFIIELWHKNPYSTPIPANSTSLDSYRLRFIYNNLVVIPTWCDKSCSLKSLLNYLDKDLKFFIDNEPYLPPSSQRPAFDFKKECKV